MKVAIYCRLSEEDRNKQNKTDDSESIQNQKSLLLQHAISKGWEVYNIYSDDDYAGADRKRPEFNKLLVDAQNKKFDIILCKTQSRFTRELEIVEKYIHGLFPLWGIRFVSIVDNADTDSKGNKKARQINGLINEWYLEDLSDNIKSVFKNKMAQGHYIGSTALYGYRKDPDKKGHLIIDNDAAEVVREVFNLFDQGYGKEVIARMLNERKIPNPTEYKRQKGISYKTPPHKNGTLWKYFAISNMLNNPMYIGHMVQGRYGSVCYKSKINKPKPKKDWIIVENTHEPIIDTELWERVQLKIKSRFRLFHTGNEGGLFSRKIKCINCGYNVRMGKTRDIKYFKCATRRISKDACEGSFISFDKVSRVVTEQINEFIQLYLDKNQLEKSIVLGSNSRNREKQLDEQIRAYEIKVADYTKAINEAYFDKSRGLIDEDEFIAMTKDYREQKNMYLKMLEETKNQKKSFEDKKDLLVDKKQVIDEFLDTKQLNRIMIDTLIDHIKIGKNNRVTKEHPIEICWNF